MYILFRLNNLSKLIREAEDTLYAEEIELSNKKLKRLL